MKLSVIETAVNELLVFLRTISAAILTDFRAGLAPLLGYNWVSVLSQDIVKARRFCENSGEYSFSSG